jgi:undecaprenyl-diphosphatase
VAIALVVGGIFLLFADRLFPGDKDLDEGLSYRKSFIIGLIQIISIIPGVSRSGATIIGGMSQKLNRKSAAEFSFFLAVPTMFAATALKVLDNYKTFSTGDIKLLAVGNLVAFVVAMIAIRTFITFLTRHGFRLFGWYRIVVGLLILILLAFGVDLSIV